MSEDWVKRKSLLIEGKTYCATQGTVSGGEYIPRGGERLHLRCAGYSRYDSSYVYEFEAEDQSLKSFWLHDSEPIERLIETFEPA